MQIEYVTAILQVGALVVAFASVLCICCCLSVCVFTTNTKGKSFMPSQATEQDSIEVHYLDLIRSTKRFVCGHANHAPLSLSQRRIPASLSELDRIEAADTLQAQQEWLQTSLSRIPVSLLFRLMPDDWNLDGVRITLPIQKTQIQDDDTDPDTDSESDSESDSDSMDTVDTMQHDTRDLQNLNTGHHTHHTNNLGDRHHPTNSDTAHRIDPTNNSADIHTVDNLGRVEIKVTCADHLKVFNSARHCKTMLYAAVRLEQRGCIIENRGDVYAILARIIDTPYRGHWYNSMHALYYGTYLHGPDFVHDYMRSFPYSIRIDFMQWNDFCRIGRMCGVGVPGKLMQAIVRWLHKTGAETLDRFSTHYSEVECIVDNDVEGMNALTLGDLSLEVSMTLCSVQCMHALLVWKGELDYTWTWHAFCDRFPRWTAYQEARRKHAMTTLDELRIPRELSVLVSFLAT